MATTSPPSITVWRLVRPGHQVAFAVDVAPAGGAQHFECSDQSFDGAIGPTLREPVPYHAHTFLAEETGFPQAEWLAALDLATIAAARPVGEDDPVYQHRLAGHSRAQIALAWCAASHAGSLQLDVSEPAAPVARRVDGEARMAWWEQLKIRKPEKLDRLLATESHAEAWAAHRGARDRYQEAFRTGMAAHAAGEANVCPLSEPELVTAWRAGWHHGYAID